MAAGDTSHDSSLLEFEPVAMLVHYDTDSGRTTFPLDKPVTLVGRQAECDITISSREVSRRHARILQRDGQTYILEDLDSLNGTYINGVRISRSCALKNGDTIVLASEPMATFTFDVHFAEASPSEGADAGRSALAKGDRSRPLQRHLPRPTAAISLHDQQRQSRHTDAEAKLEAILEITRALGNSLDLRDVLDKTVNGLFRIFPQCESGYVLLQNEDGELEPAVMHSRESDAKTMSPVSRTLAQQALGEGKALLCSEPADAALDDVVLDGGTRSYMCAPLLGPSGTALGAIQIDTTDRRREFTHRDLDVLASVATLAGQAVENSRMHETRLRLAHREHQLLLAREVQRQFLPQKSPEIAGYEFCEFYAAADEVAGDFFDYIPLPNERIGIVIGDVCGKGVSAALLMARLCASIRLQVTSARTPMEAAHNLNNEMVEACLEDRFVSLVLGVFDPRSHELMLVSAGHPPPLWMHAGEKGVEPLADATGMPLGVNRDERYLPSLVQFAPGDMLLLYTDGVSEAMGADGKLYGVESIRSVLTSHPAPEAVVHRTVADVRRHSQNSRYDDICLLALGRLDER